MSVIPTTKSLCNQVLRSLQTLCSSLDVKITYQDIADHVEQESQTNDEIELNLIRRRVMDILNVLVASGMLHKNKVHLSLSDDLDEETISTLESRIEKKHLTLSTLLVQQLLLHQMVLHNKQNEIQNQELSDEKITMPFLAIVAEKKEEGNSETYKLLVSEDSKSATISFPHTFTLHDDMDILMRMKLLDQVTEETIRKLIPETLFSFLPEELSSKIIAKPPLHKKTKI
jgi:hypothetical protein